MLTWIQDSTLWAEIDAERGFQMYTEGMTVYLTHLLMLALFSSGVLDDDPTCSQTSIDHVVNSNRYCLFVYLLIQLFF
jgi:hypothetical protein